MLSFRWKVETESFRETNWTLSNWDFNETHKFKKEEESKDFITECQIETKDFIGHCDPWLNWKSKNKILNHFGGHLWSGQ